MYNITPFYSTFYRLPLARCLQRLYLKEILQMIHKCAQNVYYISKITRVYQSFLLILLREICHMNAFSSAICLPVK